VTYKKMKKEFDQNVAALIRMGRKAKGWSQIELAEKMNTTQSVVSGWETGKRPLASVNRLMKLCKLLGVRANLVVQDRTTKKITHEVKLGV